MMEIERKFKELIEDECQTDGLYPVAYPKVPCHIRLRRDMKLYDVNMALIDDRDKVLFLISYDGDNDTKIDYIPLLSISSPTIDYLYDCFRENKND